MADTKKQSQNNGFKLNGKVSQDFWILVTSKWNSFK